MVITWNSAGWTVALANLTVLIIQFVKPFIELIPGITLAQNKTAHDNLIRLIQFLVNLALLLLVQAFIPGVYDGVTLLGFIVTLIGQPLISELTYQQTSKGGSPTSTVTLLSTNTGAGTATVTATTTTIPTVPPLPTIPKE